MIDTLAASEQLVDAGLPADHARAIARLMSGAQVAAQDGLSTKSDLQNVQTQLDALRKDVSLSEASLRQEIKTSNAELKADIVRWLFASQLVMVVAIVGLITALKHFG